ncbi:LysR family transcriptional regulator [Paenibacillus hamazuiensis]|uniref:LysR family transcriptional regulator n=1 Tax=Paenibacillus hamazuiensis TaxID=2936508 RepID=UPI00200F0DD2
MELRQLKTFMAVCEEMHFTRAAEKLGISQPTLSQQIRAMEEELDVPLFDRVGKKIVLTQAGRLLHEHGLQIVRQLDNALDAIAELRDHRRGSLIVGVLPSDLDYRISGMLIDYHNEFPFIHLKVVSSIEIVQQVLDSEVDIGIGLMAEPDSRLVRMPLCREEYVLVVSERHPLAGRREITYEELCDVDTVMFPRGYIGRELVEGCCSRYGLSLRTIMETGTVTSLIQLVRANIGATIQPRPLIESMNGEGLRCITIAGSPPIRSLEIIHRSDRYIGKAASTFIRKVIGHFRP